MEANIHGTESLETPKPRQSRAGAGLGSELRFGDFEKSISQKRYSLIHVRILLNPETESLGW